LPVVHNIYAKGNKGASGNYGNIIMWRSTQTQLTICVKRSMVAVSPNCYCHGNSTTLLIAYIVVDLHSAVNNIKVFSAEMVMQQ